MGDDLSDGASLIVKPGPWKPQYGYRRSVGWRQKILYGNDWDYPREGRERPFRTALFVHPSRRWRTLFFARSLGLKIIANRSVLAGTIAVEVQAELTPKRLSAFVEHCRRTRLTEQRLGLPGVHLTRFGPKRPRTS
jgi:hypothetical protein